MNHIPMRMHAPSLRPVKLTRRALAKQQTRLKVLAAARKLFSEEGYEGADSQHGHNGEGEPGQGGERAGESICAAPSGEGNDEGQGFVGPDRLRLRPGVAESLVALRAAGFRQR